MTYHGKGLLAWQILTVGGHISHTYIKLTSPTCVGTVADDELEYRSGKIIVDWQSVKNSFGC